MIAMAYVIFVKGKPTFQVSIYAIFSQKTER